MKEYFTTSYEQKRKNKLLELNEKYNQLLSLYKSESDSSKKTETARELYKYNSTIMTELDAYLDLIESQINILSDKNSELSDLNAKLIELENINPVIDYTNDITELEKANKTVKLINIVLLIICILLITVFFFFVLVVINVKKK
jgi:hypothetical protein